MWNDLPRKWWCYPTVNCFKGRFDRYSDDNRYSMEWRYGSPVNAEETTTQSRQLVNTWRSVMCWRDVETRWTGRSVNRHFSYMTEDWWWWWWWWWWCRKSGSRNAMVTTDFRSDVKIWLFRACTTKNMHYNPYYMNSSVIVDSVRYHIPQNVFLVLNVAVVFTVFLLIVILHVSMCVCHLESNKLTYLLN